MSDLIPKHDYFKHTTRVMLSEAEKQEMADAADRGLTYLLGMSRKFKLNKEALTFNPEQWRMFAIQSRYLNRCIPLLKGTTQPPYLYRRQRRTEVILEAWFIARETGATHQDVKEMFLNLMGGFISSYP